MKKETTAKIIRVITVAPIMVIVLISVLFFTHSGDFIPNIRDYLTAALFLAVLPVLAYPIQPIVPYFKDRGRAGQRTLAMIMSAIGYVLGVIYALIFCQTPSVVLFSTYLISAIVLLVLDKLCHFKASGHACGTVGPFAVLTYCFGWVPAIIGSVVFAAVIWASLCMKRHTLPQLLVGGVAPIIIFAVLTLSVG